MQKLLYICCVYSCVAVRDGLQYRLSLPLVLHDLHLRLTLGMQLYGGGVSLVVGAYVWSLSAYGSGSMSYAGATIVSELSAVLNNCRINDGANSASCALC